MKRTGDPNSFPARKSSFHPPLQKTPWKCLPWQCWRTQPSLTTDHRPQRNWPRPASPGEASWVVQLRGTLATCPSRLHTLCGKIVRHGRPLLSAQGHHIPEKAASRGTEREGTLKIENKKSSLRNELQIDSEERVPLARYSLNGVFTSDSRNGLRRGISRGNGWSIP